MPIDEPLIYHHPVTAAHGDHRFVIKPDNPADPRGVFVLYARSMGLAVHSYDRGKLERIAELLIAGEMGVLSLDHPSLTWS